MVITRKILTGKQNENKFHLTKFLKQHMSNMKCYQTTMKITVSEYTNLFPFKKNNENTD